MFTRGMGLSECALEFVSLESGVGMSNISKNTTI